MMQGGGLGILGNFLFGDYNRFGRNVGETILGPVLGQGRPSFLELRNRAKEGQDLAPEAFRTRVYKRALHQPVLHPLGARLPVLVAGAGCAEPGFLRRFERRIESQNHQTVWLRPSEVVARRHAPPRHHAD
jgi:hypothetical protein